VSASGCAIEGIAMSDAKVVSLVAHETRRVQAETTAELEALTKDFYAALVPLQAAITKLRSDVDKLMSQP
jgi:hypothetical protein